MLSPGWLILGVGSLFESYRRIINIQRLSEKQSPAQGTNPLSRKEVGTHILLLPNVHHLAASKIIATTIGRTQ